MVQTKNLFEERSRRIVDFFSPDNKSNPHTYLGVWRTTPYSRIGTLTIVKMAIL